MDNLVSASSWPHSHWLTQIFGLFKVFDKHSNFRQTLKNAAKIIVPVRYGYAIDPPEFNTTGHNQNERYSKVEDGAEQLLQNACFVRAQEFDENVSCHLS